MVIANPIYDEVFKYLMANRDIAKGVITTIIDEEIVTLDFKAQESVYKSESKFTVYHLDFIAKIRDKEGEYKNVLIEIQKSNLPYNIMRFRRYLGDQYKKEDDIILADGKTSKEPLPILTIYFLGFYISKTLPGVIKVDRNYIDVLGGKEIHEKNDFIEKLSHNCYVIQIPGLHLQMRNRLEYVLSIFQQEKFLDDKTRRLKNYDYETDDELMIKILRELSKAAGDKELLRKLELEEMAMMEYESAFGELQGKIKKQEKDLEKKDKYIRELLEKLEILKKK